MVWLLETSVIGRLVNNHDPLQDMASNAIVQIRREGGILRLTPQCLIEFRNFATRPAYANGLEMPAAVVEDLCREYELSFPILPDIPEIFEAWKALVAAENIVGKQVHDARLVAVCHAHGVPNILTFNTGHFRRMATFGPGVNVVHPKDYPTAE